MFDVPFGRRTALCARECQPPAAAFAVRRTCRKCGHAPARARGTRPVEFAGRAQKQGHRAAHLGGKLQAPRLREIDVVDLGDRTGQCRIAQRLLEGPQRVGALGRVDDEQARRLEPERREAGGTQVGAACDPQHRAVAGEPGEKGGREAGSGSVVRGAGDLMQGASRQTWPGQG